MTTTPRHKVDSQPSAEWATAWAQVCQPRASLLLPAGSRLFAQGDVCSAVYLIKAGCVKLVYSDYGGHDTVVALRPPGWVVGCAAAILAMPHPVSAFAQSACDVEVAGIREFYRAYVESIDFARAIGLMHAAEIHEQIGQSCLRGSGGASTRLERLLVRLAEGGAECLKDGSVRLLTHLTHEEMAQVIGARRETVSRLLATFQRRKVVYVSNGWIVLAPQSRLEAEYRRARADWTPASHS